MWASARPRCAIRAAFKCVTNSKQCAVLVPTTILAWQHYQTVPAAHGGVSRCDIELLSRFRTPKQQEEIVKDIRSAAWSTLSSAPIGVIQKDVQFKDLGPCHHRRGTAVRCGAEGAVQGDVPTVRCARPLGDPHSPDPQHGDDRHPRYVGHRGGAARPSPGADLRAGIRPRRHHGRHPAGTAPRRAGLSTSTTTSPPSSASPRGSRRGAGGAHRHRPRQDERAGALRNLAAADGARDRHPRLHDDHRNRRGRAEREHADHRQRRPHGPFAAAPAARARWPQHAARLRLLHVHARQGFKRDLAEAPFGDPRIHGVRLRLQDRDARPRDPRRGQHPRRRAARPHGERRLRHVPEAAERGRRA